jgi:hypothetical protein
MTFAVNLAQSASNNVTMRNRIINGAMTIDQRNAGASVTPASGDLTLDRYRCYMSQASKFSVQQNAGAVTPPTGFSNYLGVTSLSAYSVLASDYFTIRQRIEGFNFADMAWGTASAQTVTLSFQVRSSLTGAFGGVLMNSAGNRAYPFSYSISVANTWTTISITIAGDTTGTWIGATNGTGVQVIFSLGAGSTYTTTANAWASGEYYAPTGATSVVGTSGATFYITGVQLEAGTAASPFENRLYGTELALCQRYYEKVSGPVYLTYVNVASSNTRSSSFFFKVTKRAVPTVTIGGTSEYIANGSGGVDTTLSPSSVTTDSMYVAGPNVGFGVFAVSYTGANNYITMNSEL